VAAKAKTSNSPSAGDRLAPKGPQARVRRRGAGLVSRLRSLPAPHQIQLLQGSALKPVPPIGKFKDVRSLDVREPDELDEKQLATWIKQAASHPRLGRRIPAPRRIPALG
jgi:hypothetical protein